MKKNPILFIALLSIIYTSNAQSICSEILKWGVFDKSIYNETLSSDDLLQVFTSNKMSSNSYDYKSTSFDLMGSLEVIGVEFGSDSEKEKARQAFSEYIWSGYNRNKLDKNIQKYVSKASKPILAGFNKCMSSSGIHASIKYKPGAEILSLELKVLGVGNPVKIDRIDFSKGITPIKDAETKGILLNPSVTYPINFKVSDPSTIPNGLVTISIVGKQLEVIGGTIRYIQISKPKMLLYNFAVNHKGNIYNHKMALIRGIDNKLSQGFLTHLQNGGLENTISSATQFSANPIMFKWKTLRTTDGYESESTLTLTNDWSAFSGKGKHISPANFGDFTITGNLVQSFSL